MKTFFKALFTNLDQAELKIYPLVLYKKQATKPNQIKTN